MNRSPFLGGIRYASKVHTQVQKTVFTLSRSGMGNFESDEGQDFLSFIPRGQITNPRPHTLYTVLLSFLFIERNESIINVICF